MTEQDCLTAEVLLTRINEHVFRDFRAAVRLGDDASIEIFDQVLETIYRAKESLWVDSREEWRKSRRLYSAKRLNALESGRHA
jgi:hypothetical protein